jgi:hypothetical protein
MTALVVNIAKNEKIELSKYSNSIGGLIRMDGV